MQILGAIICCLVVVRLVQSVILERRSAARRQARLSQSLTLIDDQIAATRSLPVRQEQQQAQWNGYRTFRVKQKVFEADTICSFYLVPHDRKALSSFRPGQFLTFRFRLAGAKKGETLQHIRCYSLSDAPRPEQYRITVKRVLAADEASLPGVISNYLLDGIEQGALLDVRAPRGDFAIDVQDNRPVVLIAGGIGITPLLSMANTVLSAGTERKVWLFYGVRNGKDHAMKEHLQRLAAAHASFHLSVAYSSPMQEEQQGNAFDRTGRITFEYLRDTITTRDCDFYICGPSGMVNSIVPALKAWGIGAARIHTEAFGPSAVGKQQTPQAVGKQQELAGAECMVEFTRCGQRHPWRSDVGSLLDLAEQHGISIDSGCRMGNCGSCEVGITRGKALSLSESTADCAAGSCLACVSIPDGNVSLDA
jgi:ferredoxin-NADP reductase/ferredoxin